jgi:hypothetical protein
MLGFERLGHIDHASSRKQNRADEVKPVSSD